MKEEFLQYIWSNALYKSHEFVTCSGKTIEIVSGGQFNKDAGPDFFNAKICMGEVLLAGNIEIHLRNSDWYRHGHHKDEAYNNVILSVVRDADVLVFNSAGAEVETIVLEYADVLYDEYIFMRNSIRWPGCMQHLRTLDRNRFDLILQSLAVERLERKCNDVRTVWGQVKGDWETCFYRTLCKYWAGNVNSDPFYQLSLSVSYKILLRYSDRLPAVEALLFGCSGLLEQVRDNDYTVSLKNEFRYLRAKHQLVPMDASQWKFMRIRPDAFPTVRIALLAAFLCGFNNWLSAILDAVSLKEVMNLLDVRASAYWDQHYSFDRESVEKSKRMGNQIKKTIIINAVIPFLFLYGRERGEEKYTEKSVVWLEQLNAEKNYVVTSWEAYGFTFDTALQTQALLQLRKEYCDKHACLKCRIGLEVFKNMGR